MNTADLYNPNSRELETYERWVQGEFAKPMKIEDLALAIKHGFPECEENCISRQICGDGGCTCIRTVFSHPDFYELYQELRKQYVLSQFLGLTKNAIRSS